MFLWFTPVVVMRLQRELLQFLQPKPQAQPVVPLQQQQQQLNQQLNTSTRRTP